MSRVARIAFAIVLIVATLLKVYEVGSNTGFWAALIGPMRLKLALAAFEFLFAGWILWNVRPAWAHRASICLAGAFAAASLYRLLLGEPDCGCFGKVAVHPAWTFALDIILLLALCYTALGNRAGGGQSHPAWPAFGVIAPLAIAAVVSAILWHLTSGGLLSRLIQGPLLVSLDPSPKAIFRAHEGETVNANFTVRNVTNEPLRLLGVNTSCSCTVVKKDFPVELRPGESRTVMVQLHVGVPGSDGTFRQEARLLVNRDGVVPPLVIEAAVSRY